MAFFFIYIAPQAPVARFNTLMRAAQVLGVALDYLIRGSKTDDASTIDGFIEVNGVVHRIRCREDIEKVLELL